MQKYDHNNYYSCDSNGQVFVNLLHTPKKMLVWQCDGDYRQCHEGRCALIDEGQEINVGWAKELESASDAVFDADVDMSIVYALEEDFSLKLMSYEGTPWTGVRVAQLDHACRSVPDWWCSRIVFTTRDIENAWAYETGLVVLGDMFDSTTIVHELIHAQRAMYGFDITNADYSKNYRRDVNEYRDENFALMAEFMAAAGWAHTADGEALVLIRNQQVITEEDINRFYKPSNMYFTHEHYGIQNQLTEHITRLGEMYYWNSAYLNEVNPALYDFYKTHWFDGCEYYEGSLVENTTCGLQQAER